MKHFITGTYKRYFILFAGFCFFSVTSFAQKDTAQKQSVSIISSYKPVLRNAVKINLTATNLTADTSRPILKYTVPAQNLFYTYSPIPIKPLALEHDTALDLGIRNFVKLGFGNYSTPYARAGLSFGDGKKKLINLYGDYISSKGNIQYQDYAQLNLKATGSYFSHSNEIYGSIGYHLYDYNLYGYDHSVYHYPKDSVFRSYQTLTVKAGLRNIISNNGGFDYDPNITIASLTSQNNITENNIIGEIPVSKKLTDDMIFKVAGTIDATAYSATKDSINIKINNTIFEVAPEVDVEKELYIAHIGITPAWDNNSLSILPNIYGEAQIKKQLFIVQAGWVGRFIKNSFSNLSIINPYLQPVTSQQNTKEVELYGGIKATLAKHFNVSGKISFITYHNLPLFINDTLSGKSFYISNEPKLNNLRLHFDMSYINQEKFTITSGLTFNGYTGLQINTHAWGELPVELTASLRWQAFKDVTIKGDFNAFGSAPYLLKNNIENTASGGADLSAGIEVVITKHLSGWLNFNNILNDKYQRWNNYPVYGLNILGGVLFKF
ncbi:MAG: hypothetical protein WDM71_08075, partial [Ferruginibacter sp.]